MTTPPLDLVKKLGPDFDYSSLSRLRSSPMFGQLPQNVQDAINGVQKVGVDIGQVSNPAGKDRIGEGAYPTPVTPPTSSEKYQDQLWSVVHTLPGIGILSQLDRAFAQSRDNNISFFDALNQEQQRTNATAQEFLHHFTAGLVKSPDVPEEQKVAFNTVTKPATALMAMGTQQLMVVKLLGMISKVPGVSSILEQIPQRLQDVGMGAATFGVTDGLRAEGIPTDPSVLDPSGHIAKKLSEIGVPDRLALVAGGGFTGGVLGASFLGIMRGFEWGRSMRMAAQATPEQLQAMQTALQSMGYSADLGTSKAQLVNQFVKVMRKVVHNEDLAGLVSENLSREEWIAQSLYGSADIAQVPTEDAKYLNGMLKGQPGQISIATSVSDPAQATLAAQKLGLNMDIVALRRTPKIATPIVEGVEPPPDTYDLLLSRPNYTYDAFAQSPRTVKRATQTIREFAKSNDRDLFAKQTNDIFILADGSTVRGGFSTEELAAKLKPQAPIVNGVPRADLGVKQASRMVNMAIKDDNRLIIELPPYLTQEQFDALGPAANTHRFDQVLIKYGDQNVVLESPLGQQVQDAAAKLVRPVKTTSKLTPELISQYKRTGVFQGQAGILPDGSPVTIQKKAGLFYEVQDPLTQATIRVHPDRITVLPSSMEAEQAPTNLFTQHLSPDEQKSFAQLRLGIQAGLDQPIEKFQDLARFANSRGFFATRIEKGIIEIRRAADGDGMVFKDLKAATQFVRKSTGPMPDLTPDVVRKVLGGQTNIGFVFPQGPPPEFGEMIPMPHETVVKALEANIAGRGPGAIQQFILPSRGLFLDLDKKYGTNFYALFSNIQQRQVAKQNFEALWYHGQGGQMPDGILPLKKIVKMAGADANQERITSWLEAKAPEDKVAIEATMTPGEKAAAPQLRKWYNGLFGQFGIEADYVENYAPRIRELAPKYGNNPQALVKAGVLSPSKGVDFWADNHRIGQLDVYDTDAFRVAQKYLSTGGSNRFLKEPISQAAEMVSKLSQVNPSLAYPMGYFLQAVKGTEFAEQRLALSESMQTLLDNLPGSIPQGQVSDIADKLTTYWMGAVYSGTMGFRPGLAMRNVASSLMMSWPLFGGSKGRFVEALGLAVTRHGLEEAVKDGAIALKTSPIYGADEFIGALPKGFDEIAKAGFAMYDTADEFTRTHVYWAARLQSEDAIARFAKAAVGAGESDLQKIRQELITKSGLHMQDKQVVEEFFRRLTISPDLAARYAGKQASDVVNFLYGRGMQARWMRGLQGRLLGQFGTWSMWYLDYLRRTTGAIASNSGNVQAAAFLAKHALINGVVAYAGKKALDIDLGSWMVYPAVFYSGGPGFQVAQGLTTLARGLGSVTAGSDDPFAQQKVVSGLQVIQQTLPSMIPFWFGARDAIRVADASDPTERLAALLGTHPTRQYSSDQKIQMVLGNPTEPFSTSSWVVDRMANSAAAGTPEGIDPKQYLEQMLGGAATATQGSVQGLGPQGSGTAPPPAAPPMLPPASGGQAPIGMPKTGARPPYANEVTKSAESKPPTTY